MTKARMFMTKISLKYAFKNAKICNYMPQNKLNIPIFSTNICKRELIININSKNVYTFLHMYLKLLYYKIHIYYFIKYENNIN